MSSHNLPAEPSASYEDENAQHYRQVLREMIDAGAELVQMIRDQAKTGSAKDAAVPYERVTRSMRRSMLLDRKLAEPVTVSRAAARRQIIRAVEDTIQRDAEDEHEADALHEELLDRLDGPDLEDDLDLRSIDAIVTEICHDLGLEAPPGTHPWKRRTPEDIATLYARATSRPPHALRGIRATPPPDP